MALKALTYASPISLKRYHSEGMTSNIFRSWNLFEDRANELVNNFGVTSFKPIVYETDKWIFEYAYKEAEHRSPSYLVYLASNPDMLDYAFRRGLTPQEIPSGAWLARGANPSFVKKLVELEVPWPSDDHCLAVNQVLSSNIIWTRFINYREIVLSQLATDPPLFIRVMSSLKLSLKSLYNPVLFNDIQLAQECYNLDHLLEAGVTKEELGRGRIFYEAMVRSTGPNFALLSWWMSQEIPVTMTAVNFGEAWLSVYINDTSFDQSSYALIGAYLSKFKINPSIDLTRQVSEAQVTL
jgi:hypothetical protein